MQQLSCLSRCSSAAPCRQQAAVTCLRSCAAVRQQGWAAFTQQPRQAVQQLRQAGQWRRCAAQASVYGSEWTTPKDAYVTVGLSHCFVKGGDGKLVDQYVIEPITANSVECMAKGARTSFIHVFSLRLEEALQRNKACYPPEYARGAFCEDYEGRCDACARTWMRPHAMDNLLDIVPLGQLKSSFNYSTAEKRVLNADNIVNDDDNIKQDMSIDVYGRKGKEESAATPAHAVPAAAAQEEDEEDDMDALLSV